MEKVGKWCCNRQVAALKEYGMDKIKDSTFSKVLPLFAQVISKSFLARVHINTVLVWNTSFHICNPRKFDQNLYSYFQKLEGGTVVLKLRVKALKSASVLHRGSSKCGLWTSRISIIGNLLGKILCPTPDL